VKTTIVIPAAKALLLLVIVLVIGLRINVRPVRTVAVSAPAPQPAEELVPPQPVGPCDLRDIIRNATTFEANTWNQVRSWCGYIIPNAAANQLDPYLIAAVMWIESHGNPQAYSHSGAVGLMQVMPSDGIATRFVNSRGQPYFSDRPTSEQLFDPAFNIYYGATLLAQNIARTGSIRDGLNAYGPEDVGYTYADAVLALYQRLRSA
jgi:soluble lytic murein transglycosylase-like protein